MKNQNAPSEHESFGLAVEALEKEFAIAMEQAHPKAMPILISTKQILKRGRLNTSPIPIRPERLPPP